MRPRWPSTGRGGRRRTRQGRSTAEDGRRRLSCLARNVAGRSPQTGEESRQGPLWSRRPRRSRSSSRLAHHRTHPERPDRTGQDGIARRLHGAHPHSRRRLPAPTPPRAHPRSPTVGAGPTTTGPLDHARAGRTLRSRLPAWTDRCAIDSTRERALSAKRPTTSARHIRGGRVEAARTAASTGQATDTEALRRKGGDALIRAAGEHASEAR